MASVISRPLCVAAIALTMLPAGAQQPTAKPDKVITPEQQALQRQYADFQQRRTMLQGAAETAFKAEAALPAADSKSPGNPCLQAESTVDWENCLGQLVQASDANLRAARHALRSLFALQAPGEPAAPMVGMEGPALTPEQQVSEFDRLEQQWDVYAKTAEGAAFHQFDGGTGAAPFAEQMHFELIQAHMRELRRLYGENFL